MKRLYFVLFVFLYSYNLFSQELAFDAPVELFPHPRTEDSGFNYPFIPLDYNSDGVTDFIGATFSDQWLYKGNADNTFTPIDIYQGFAHTPLKVMDFDRDGDMDVIMERYINLYAEADSFTFFNVSINFAEEIVEVADFNDDGHNDLLAYKSGVFESDAITIHYNNGDNTFTSSVIHSEYDYGAMDVGDIDDDGDLDIVAMLNFEDDPAVILFNNGMSDFSSTVLNTNLELTRATVDLEDLDFDGDLDIVTIGAFNSIYLFENTDNFQSNASSDKISLSSIVFTRLADLNNDGKKDILAVTNQNGMFNLYHVKSNGGFNYDSASRIESFTGSSFFGYPNFNYLKNNLSVYDFDGDGKSDLIYTDGFGEPNKIFMIKNISDVSATTPVPSDGLEHISLYPNPVVETVSILSDRIFADNLEYKIISNNGIVVSSGITSNKTINVSDLPAGNYHILLNENGNKSKTYYSEFVKIN